MGLYTWNKPLDPYDYVQLTDNWNHVDYHDHTPGRGVQIPMGGIAVGAVGPLQLAFVPSQVGVWVSLVPNLAGGVSAASSRYVPSARLEGNNDVVRFKGAISSGSAIGAGSTWMTLPSQFWPTQPVTTVSGISVTTAGVVSNVNSGTSLSLDNLSYTLS